jgi:hypothetical protein
MPIGHQSFRTTEIYTHVSTEALRKISSPLNLLINGGVRGKLTEDLRLLENTDKKQKSQVAYSH